jgi:predicted membrane protein
VHVAWYVGVTVMALFEVIEWPLAIVIAVGHEIAHRSRSKALRELADGIEAAG